MNAKKGHSQSADNSQLLAHKSSPQGGHAFKLKAPYEPTGDQPQAIAELVKGFKEGNQCQTLLGNLCSPSHFVFIVQGRQSMPDFIRGYGFWKNFYDGKCDSAITEADTCHCS